MLTSAYYSQTYLDLFAFVIANTFPLISTSQNCVTVSIMKQWVFFCTLKKFPSWIKTFGKLLSLKMKEETTQQGEINFQRTDGRNCSFCEIENFLWTSPLPILSVPTHCLKRYVASFLHEMPISLFLFLFSC